MSFRRGGISGCVERALEAGAARARIGGAHSAHAVGPCQERGDGDPGRFPRSRHNGRDHGRRYGAARNLDAAPGPNAMTTILTQTVARLLFLPTFMIALATLVKG